MTSQALDPPPLSHFVTHPGTSKVRHTFPTPHFSRPSTKIRTKAPCTYSLSIVREGFYPGTSVRGSFVWKVLSRGFVRGGLCPFPFLTEYICYNRKLNITLKFMFHMYDKNFY